MSNIHDGHTFIGSVNDLESSFTKRDRCCFSSDTLLYGKCKQQGRSAAGVDSRPGKWNSCYFLISTIYKSSYLICTRVLKSAGLYRASVLMCGRKTYLPSNYQFLMSKNAYMLNTVFER